MSFINPATVVVPFMSYVVARVVDQGLADTLGLVTLRHGTNPISWLGIHILGAQPYMGASTIGGDHGVGYDSQNTNRFYFACEYNEDKSILEMSRDEVAKFLKIREEPSQLAALYSRSSTINLLSSIHIPKCIGSTLVKIAKIATFDVFMPTIKFRVSPEWAQKLRSGSFSSCKVDGNCYIRDCSTSESVSPLNIGIIGTIWNSLTNRVGKRIVQNPNKLILGIAQLAIAASATAIAIAYDPNLFSEYPSKVIVPIVLAIV